MIYVNKPQMYNGSKVIVNPVIEKTLFETLDTLLDKCFATEGIILEVNSQQGERIRPYFKNSPVLRFEIELDSERGFFSANRPALMSIMGSYKKDDLMNQEVLCYRLKDLRVLGDDVSERQIYAINFKNGI